MILTITCLLFQCFISLLMVTNSNVFQLINYFSIILWFSMAVCIAGLLYLRYSKPKLHRPIRVNLILPIVFLLCCLFLISVSIFTEPLNAGMYLQMIINNFLKMKLAYFLLNFFYFNLL